ncbi:DUF397 domain-containing protein [Streptomyces sp. NPDC000348]|uniref:DUF397 domain-containing protein n=1 Tax=Streptomyces sp. NPDC000348 TaxID=3364538 RepID=UPI0036A40322
MRVHRQANSLGSRAVTDGANGSDCVEVVVAPGAVRVRDSKAQAEAVPAFPREQWAAFTAYAGEIAV